MLAAKTSLPVIGVPIPTQHLGGLDSLLSIVQMPRGIPVATVAIGNADNAALLAAAILALGDAGLAARLDGLPRGPDGRRPGRRVERGAAARLIAAGRHTAVRVARRGDALSGRCDSPRGRIGGAVEELGPDSCRIAVDLLDRGLELTPRRVRTGR